MLNKQHDDFYDRLNNIKLWPVYVFIAFKSEINKFILQFFAEDNYLWLSKYSKF